MAEVLCSSVSAEGLQNVKEYKQETTVSGKGSLFPHANFTRIMSFSIEKSYCFLVVHTLNSSARHILLHAV